MPEVLQNAGFSWKVYTPNNSDVANIPQYAALNLGQYVTWAPGFYTPENPEVLPSTDNVLPYFPTFRDESSPLYDLAFNQTFPGQFYKDVQNDMLPSVSWIIPPLGFDEHPAASSRNGEWFTSLVLEALVSNPEVWSKTALLLMYDENDGWFDHVAPPTAPTGTPGEYLTAQAAYPIRRPGRDGGRDRREAGWNRQGDQGSSRPRHARAGADDLSVQQRRARGQQRI